MVVEWAVDLAVPKDAVEVGSSAVLLVSGLVVVKDNEKAVVKVSQLDIWMVAMRDAM